MHGKVASCRRAVKEESAANEGRGERGKETRIDRTVMRKTNVEKKQEKKNK